MQKAEEQFDSAVGLRNEAKNTQDEEKRTRKETRKLHFHANFAFLSDPFNQIGNRFSILKNDSRACLGPPPKVFKKIEHMPTEHPKVFASAPAVPFPVALQLQQSADPSVLNQSLNDRQSRMIAVTVGHRDIRSLSVGRLDDAISLGRRTAKGLFHINSFHASFDGGQGHLHMLIRMPWRHGNELGTRI